MMKLTINIYSPAVAEGQTERPGRRRRPASLLGATLPAREQSPEIMRAEADGLEKI